MDEEFKHRGYPTQTASLVRSFLKLYHIIHQINQDTYLVPSSIRPHPDLPLTSELGSFPGREDHLLHLSTLEDEGRLTSFQIGPAIAQRPDNVDIKVKKTGLVYRRLFHLPPIASGFWSKVISLFIQKQDFPIIVKGATPDGFSLHRGAAQQLTTLIGSSTLQWHYWRTGIMLFLNSELLLRVNSLRCHDFEDPQKQQVLSATQEKVKYFHYHTSAGWQFIPSHFTEVIEVIVPNVQLVVLDSPSADCSNSPVSAKLLTKALEIIDEVLKSHCEHLAMTGIYTVNDMLHVVPCPICFGDADLRETTGRRGDLPASSRYLALRPTNLSPGLSDSIPSSRPYSTTSPVGMQPPPLPGRLAQSMRSSETSEQASEQQHDSCYVFTVDECIKQTFTSDYIQCPKHGNLEFQHLLPDLVSCNCFPVLSSGLDVPTTI